jgi:hypothetical protein
MAIQDFTTGQVLTAAQMDSLQANDYNQTVSTKTADYTLVAADKGTRVVMNAAGATTITVDDSLFTAGDTLQLQNIGAGVTRLRLVRLRCRALARWLFRNTAAAHYFSVVQV